MRKHKGFTLIELVVVVMILGILAAVAAPKLLNTSSTAADNGLKQTLGVVRDAIERYAAEHAGKLPGDAGHGSRPQGRFGSVPARRVSEVPGRRRQRPGKDHDAAGAIVADASATPAESWHYNSRRRPVHLQLGHANEERSDRQLRRAITSIG